RSAPAAPRRAPPQRGTARRAPEEGPRSRRVAYLQRPGRDATERSECSIAGEIDPRGMSEILDRAPQERVVAQRLRVGEHPAGADLAHWKRYGGGEDERIGDLGQDVAPRLRRRRAVPVPEPGGRIRDDHALVPEVVSQRGERLREEQIARAGAPQREHVEPGRARREHLGGAEGSAAAEELRATVDREHVPARERRPLEGERLVLERHVARGDEGEMAVR